MSMKWQTHQIYNTPSSALWKWKTNLCLFVTCYILLYFLNFWWSKVLPTSVEEADLNHSLPASENQCQRQLKYFHTVHVHCVCLGPMQVNKAKCKIMIHVYFFLKSVSLLCCKAARFVLWEFDGCSFWMCKMTKISVRSCDMLNILQSLIVPVSEDAKIFTLQKPTFHSYKCLHLFVSWCTDEVVQFCPT